MVPISKLSSALPGTSAMDAGPDAAAYAAAANPAAIAPTAMNLTMRPRIFFSPVNPDAHVIVHRPGIKPLDVSPHTVRNRPCTPPSVVAGLATAHPRRARHVAQTWQAAGDPPPLRRKADA